MEGKRVSIMKGKRVSIISPFMYSGDKGKIVDDLGNGEFIITTDEGHDILLKRSQFQVEKG